uniref:Large ribosomal subunit protein bL21m n=1 Tax=Felis catus TaxID=9685 RepID=A0ABI8ASR6_FELCA
VGLGRLASACSRSVLSASGPGAGPVLPEGGKLRLGSQSLASLGSASRRFGSQSTSVPQGYVPETSLSSPPWPEVVLPDPAEETRQHAEVVGKVNELIATGQYGRLFAVVHFASHQWKVTSEDLILIDNELDVACGERIRLEKVRLSVTVTRRVIPLPGRITGETPSGRRVKASIPVGQESSILPEGGRQGGAGGCPPTHPPRRPCHREAGSTFRRGKYVC